MLGKELFNVDAHVTDRDSYSEIAFHSVPLTVWWESCGFVKTAPVDGYEGMGWQPHIPDAVLATNCPETYHAFVRGLFEADRTVTSGYPTWSTTSVGFSRDIQSLLLSVGYPTTRNMTRTVGSDSPLAVLSILSDSCATGFAEEIGFMSDRNHVACSTSVSGVPENVPSLDPYRSGKADRGYFYTRVSSVALGEPQWTYDLSVPRNVTYVANGFVSHNTIGLVMDCDTTGVEPDFALVKLKKLAGGGYFKIANQSVAPALRRLGYSPDQIQDILTYVVGTCSLTGTPYINPDTLTDRGFTSDDLSAVANMLAGVFELSQALHPSVLGKDTMRRIGFSEADYTAAGFDLPAALGFSNDEISQANDAICGRHTIEGAPAVRDEHLPVFDCANRSGRYGKRFIHHTGHIRMLAATQPFISGAISKTINMPNEVSLGDVADAYMMSWQLGLKAMAVYRDGSKASQPLSVVTEDNVSDAIADVERDVRLAWSRLPDGISPTEAYAEHPRPRFLLPARRTGWTQEARIGGYKVFLRTGQYDDGTLGEIFLDLAKEGATLRGFLASFAIAVSKGLQYGVPLDEFVDTFVFQTFEPRGRSRRPSEHKDGQLDNRLHFQSSRR